MHSQYPPVLRLETHLEDQNTTIFKDNELIKDIKEKQKNTKRTAWFKLNSEDPNARNILYHDIPKYYVWKSTQRIWQRRKHDKVSDMIGRLHFINPNNLER